MLKDFSLAGVFFVWYHQQMRVVGCFLEFDGRFVILLRHSHKPDGNTWGLPSGKVEPGESDVQAVLRELHEETGYKADATELQHLGDYRFVSSTNKPYTYVTYRLKLKDEHSLVLEDVAHADHKWVTAEECYAKTDLISGFHELLKLTGYIK
jgi:8-oxo-dGTP diphosphatase